jgi:hypothetical protein
VGTGLSTLLLPDEVTKIELAQVEFIACLKLFHAVEIHFQACSALLPPDCSAG